MHRGRLHDSGSVDPTSVDQLDPRLAAFCVELRAMHLDFPSSCAREASRAQDQWAEPRFSSPFYTAYGAISSLPSTRANSGECMDAVRNVHVCLDKCARCNVRSLIYSRSVTTGCAPQIVKRAPAFTLTAFGSPLTTFSNPSWKVHVPRLQRTTQAIRDGFLPRAERFPLDSSIAWRGYPHVARRGQRPRQRVKPG